MENLFSKESLSLRQFKFIIREYLEFQIQKIDWSLLNHGGSLAACELLAIAIDATEAINQDSKQNFSLLTRMYPK
jgi:hypothetical protein